MLKLIPRHVPPLSLMLDDLGRPSVTLLCVALGVSPRTVRRWQEKDDAPRVVLLALFWLTRWGQGAVNCKAHNDAVMYAGYSSCLRAEVDALRAELGRVLALADTGAANGPSWHHLPLATVTPIGAALVRAKAPRPTAF